MRRGTKTKSRSYLNILQDDTNFDFTVLSLVINIFATCF